MAASSNHSFSASALDKKLKGLNSTLQSIQGTSQWLIHYRKNAKTIVSQWYKELQNGEVKVHIMDDGVHNNYVLVESNKKLTLLYLANDVIQNAKKKGPEFKAEFVRILPRAFQNASREKDESFSKAVERIISVWEERKVFEPDAIVRFKSMLGNIHMPFAMPLPLTSPFHTFL